MALSKTDLDAISRLLDEKLDERFNRHNDAWEARIEGLEKDVAELQATDHRRQEAVGKYEQAMLAYSVYQEQQAERLTPQSLRPGEGRVYRPQPEYRAPTGGSIIEPMQDWRRKPGY